MEKAVGEKLRLFTIFVVAALLSFGVQGCEKGEEVSEVGTQGLTVSFLPGAPPSQVSREQSFSIYSSLENKGGYDLKIGEAKLFLGGLLPDIFSLGSADLEKDNTKVLRKATALTTGGKERIIFTDAAAYVGSVVPFNQSVIVKTCYQYESNARFDACFALVGGAVCSLEGDLIEEASRTSGPLQVTSVTEARSGKNLLLKFKVENLGGGKVYPPNVVCEAPPAFDMNRVLVTVQTDEEIDCSDFLGGAKFGEADVGSVVVCKRDMQDVSEHTAPVNINLRYSYVELEEFKIGVTE